MKLSIILPAYHEGENLDILLPKIREAMNGLTDDFEILVVDAMECTDSTKSAASANSAIYLSRENDDYYGSAVRTGIRNAKFEKIMFMDSDGSHSPTYIKKLLEYADEYDIVIASRYIENGETENNFVLVFISLVLNLVYSKLFNLNVKDVSNSFKIYNRDDLKSLTLNCNHFDIIEEILIKIVLKNPRTKIKEIPILFKKRMFGKSKRSFLVFVFSYMKTLVRLFKYKIDYKKENHQ